MPKKPHPGHVLPDEGAMRRVEMRQNLALGGGQPIPGETAPLPPSAAPPPSSPPSDPPVTSILPPQTGSAAPPATPPAAPAPAAAAPAPDPNRPAWLPKEYATVDAFLKAQADRDTLLARQGQELKQLREAAIREEAARQAAAAAANQPPAGNAPPPQGTPPGQPPAAPATQPPVGGAVPEGNALSDAEAKAIHDQYTKHGTLTPEQYQMFKERFNAGASMANEYVEGRILKAQEAKRRLYSIVGGEDGFQKKSEWSKNPANLAPGDHARISQLLSSDRIADIEAGAKEWVRLYELSMGRAPENLPYNGPTGQAKGKMTTKELRQGLRVALFGQGRQAEEAFANVTSQYRERGLE